MQQCSTLWLPISAILSLSIHHSMEMQMQWAKCNCVLARENLQSQQRQILQILCRITCFLLSLMPSACLNLQCCSTTLQLYQNPPPLTFHFHTPCFISLLNQFLYFCQLWVTSCLSPPTIHSFSPCNIPESSYFPILLSTLNLLYGSQLPATTPHLCPI